MEEQVEKKKRGRVDHLSKEAQEVISSKKLSGKHNLKEWFRLLRELANFDEGVDKLRSRSTTLGIVFLVLAIPLFIVAFAFWPFFILVAVSAGLSIYFFIKMSKYGKIDLANDFRLLLVPFLQAVQEDINPKGRIDLSLDLSGPTKEKIVSSEKIDPGRFNKVVETIYQDPWCKMDAPLAEGSRLHLILDNEYISHDRYYRGSSGKSKHKQKWKKYVTVSAGISSKADWVSFDKQAVDKFAESGKIKYADKEKGERAMLTRKFKFKGVNESPEVTVNEEELVGMFFQLGSMIQPDVNREQAS